MQLASSPVDAASRAASDPSPSRPSPNIPAGLPRVRPLRPGGVEEAGRLLSPDRRSVGRVRRRGSRSPPVSPVQGDGPASGSRQASAPPSRKKNGARARAFTATIFRPAGVSPGSEEEEARVFDERCGRAYSHVLEVPGQVENCVAGARDGSGGGECVGSDSVGLDPLGELCESFYEHFSSRLKFFSFVIHKCPETGRFHAHFLACFKHPIAFSSLTSVFPVWHFEIVHSVEGMLGYVEKDEGDVVVPARSFGERPAPGKRTDLSVVRECLSEGGSMRDVCSVASSAQSIQAAKTLLTYTELPRNPDDEPPVVLWFHGSTGAGKTRGAFDHFKEMGFDYTRVWTSGENLKWFDGYDRHECVIVDEFRKDYCTLHFLLRLLDRYPLLVPFKGGFRQWVPKCIIITSPFEPSDLYASSGEVVLQLTRRLSEIRLFGTPVPYVSGGASAPHFVAPLT